MGERQPHREAYGERGREIETRNKERGVGDRWTKTERERETENE